MNSLLALFRNWKILRFIIKHGDIISTIVREQSLNDAGADAVRRFRDEAYTLLPRRYQLILSELHQIGLIPESVAFELYYDHAQATVLGGQIIVIDENGTPHIKNVFAPAFPWRDDPVMLSHAPDELLTKIYTLEHDSSKARRSQSAFLATLKLLAKTAKRKTRR